MSELERYSSIALEIREMARKDQEMRERARVNWELFDPQIDKANTERLKEIVDTCGWPLISQIERKTAYDAWILVQHATDDLPFQEHCLALMKAAPKGEVEQKLIAYLEDRTELANGREQIYGTQFFTNESGELVCSPIKNPTEVDQRRVAVGMEPLSEYEKGLREFYSQK